MPEALREFQNAFARALLDPDSPPADARIARLAAQPGFAVYRNTVMKGCIDALQANYPAVTRLVGEEWFRAAAAVYARAYPPARPTLLYYGEDFARFLAGFAPAQALPWLADVARLDRFWTAAHAAASEPPVTAAAVAALPAQALAGTVLRPHASARWAWFADAPIVTIWRHNRAAEESVASGEMPWHGEGVLIVRPHGAVDSHDLDHAGCVFLDHCAAGATLGQAAAAAVGGDPDCDIASLMAQLLQVGAFARPEIHPLPLEE